MPHSVPAARPLPLALALALGVGGLPLALGAASGAAAAPPRQEVLSGSVHAAVHGEALRLSGRVPALSARPVALQRRTAQRWLAIDSARTDAGGRFAFDRRTRATSTTYRVVADRTRAGQDRAVTPRFRVATLPQFADLQAPATVDRDGAATATATLTPARAGRVVRLERAVGDGWTRVDRRPQSATGEVTFTLPTTAEGVETYRVVGRAWEGAPRVTSAASTLTVADPRDTTAPAVPAGLSATPGDGTATLTWDPVLDEDLAGYRVHTAAAPDGPWTPLAGDLTTATTITLDDLANGAPVSLSVTSLDATGNESDRAIPVTVTPADTTAPSTPDGVTLTSEPGTGEATLSWQAVDDPGLAGYRLERATRLDGPWTPVGEALTTLTSSTLTGLAYGHPVHLRVSAYDEAGNASAVSTPRSVTPARVVRLVSDVPYSSALAEHDQSDDGRLVVFSSAAALVAEDTNGVADVYLRDRSTGGVQLVSSAPEGLPANNVSHQPTVSGDGRWVAFRSLASNLVPDGRHGIYLWDRATGQTRLVSRTPAGAAASGFYYGPSIDDAGDRIAYRSTSTQLTPADTDSAYDVFVWDRDSSTTTRVSTSTSGGRPSTGVPYAVPSRISGDGQHVVWTSSASDVVPGDTNGTYDVFLWDAASGSNTLVSRTPQGTSANQQSVDATISDDGDRVAFGSQATDIVAGASPYQRNVYLWKRGEGVTLAATGSSPFLSGDGTRITSLGSAANGSLFVMVRTLAGGVNELSVRATIDGQDVNGHSVGPVLDDDGSEVLFLTVASNLTPGATPQAADLVTWGSR